MDSKLDKYKEIALQRSKKLAVFVKKQWRWILLAICLFIVLFIYFRSIFRRVPRALKSVKEYAKRANPVPLLENKEVMDGNFKLCDFYVSSSYRSYIPYCQKWDYSSVDAIEEVLRAGARFVHLDIFPNLWCWDSPPVVTNGVEEGLYNYTTKLCLDQCMERIAETAFSNEIRNNSDPLFIYLNITCYDNYKLLEKIANILDKHIGVRALGPEYNWRDQNLAWVPIKEFIGKVVIISNRGWEGSPMAEFVNMTPDASFFRTMNHEQVQNTLDQKELREYNKQNFTYVYPVFKGRNPDNYNPSIALLAGCQFVCMNWPHDNAFMDFYADRFKDASFILKPEPLRYKPLEYPDPKPQTPAVSMAPRTEATPFYQITY